MAQWARIEIAGGDGSYRLPPVRVEYAGVILSLPGRKIQIPRPITIQKCTFASSGITMPDWY